MAAPAAPLIVAQLVLLAIFDLAGRLEFTLPVLAAAAAGLLWARRRLGARGASAVGILAVAALLRLLALPLPPSLSDDVWRYLWDGRVAAAGFDPYELAPAAAELEPLRDDLWERVAHRQVATVYPPLALALFALAARLPAPLLALKGALAAIDLVTCGLLVALARGTGSRRGRPERAVWYAWNPLPVVEIAGMGHVDALGVAAAVAAVFALGRRPPRVAAGATAAAAAVLAKLVPLVALPGWAGGSRRPVAFVAIAAALVAIALAPVVAAGGVPAGWLEFGVSWEFNGPLFEPLWRALEALEVPERLAAGLDWAKRESGRHELWNRLYPWNYPQLLAKLLLAALAAPALVWAWRRPGLVDRTEASFGVLVLLSATVYPWYLIWVLPWAALTERPAWLALSTLLFLSYVPQFRALELFPLAWGAIWLPALGLAAGSWVARLRR